MWGDVSPAERLRAITRRGLADDDLAVEAAEALGAFATQPAHLVVACRRVLAHHRAHGVLWWLSARILAAPEPAAAASEAARLLQQDHTASRIAATLPLLDDDEVVAVVGWPVAADDAFAQRQDVAVVAVRSRGADPAPGLRRRRTERAVRVVDAWTPIAARVRVLLVPAAGIGPERALVTAGTATVLDGIGRTAGATWLIGGVGRVLPARVYDAMVAAAAGDDVEEIDLQLVDRIAGPRGVEPAPDAARRSDCPTAPELLRPLD